jgi:hypothetical protein
MTSFLPTVPIGCQRKAFLRTVERIHSNTVDLASFCGTSAHPKCKVFGDFIKSLALIVTQNAIKVSSYAGSQLVQ